MSEFSIVTRGLNLWYGSFQALIDVSVRMRHRFITSLIGPSGCGKTTLLRCFNRVNERYDYVRTAGEIEILGQNIYAPEVSLVELRKAVGMVFQRPNPLPISVYENVVFGLRIHSGAIKRSEVDGAVEMALTRAGLWKDLKDRLHVVDHGPGVPAGDRERIFAPFQRLHDRTNTVGLGLGLAIARGIVEAHGGTIAVESTPGKGSVFTIRIPRLALLPPGSRGPRERKQGPDEGARSAA